MARSFVTKKLNKLFVLTYFFEENRFSVMKLKDCLPKDTLDFMTMNNNFRIEEWNRDQVMQVSWNGVCHPARFLQFGDDRKKMNEIVARLDEKVITVDDVCILQCDDVKRNHHLKSAVDYDDQIKTDPHLSSSSAATTNKSSTTENNLIAVKEEVEENDDTEITIIDVVNVSVEKVTAIDETSNDINENHQMKRRSQSSTISKVPKNEASRKQNSENILFAVPEEMEENDDREIMFDATNSKVKKMMFSETSSDKNESHQMKRKSRPPLISKVTKNKATQHNSENTSLAVAEDIEERDDSVMPNTINSPEETMTVVETFNDVNESQQMDKTTRKRTSENFSTLAVKNSIDTGCDRCTFLSDYNKVLKKQCKSLEKENCELNGENASLKAKLKIWKEKYRSFKKQMKCHERTVDSDKIQIGSSTLVSKSKISMCRTSNVSKFTGDLLDVVFGRDTLSKSCIKSVNGSTKTPLDADSLKDILLFASTKFNVDISVVRAAVRQKLNTCHKALVQSS